MDSIDRSRQQLSKELYRREYYLGLLADLTGRPGLIIVKGQRRTGKSSVVISFLQQQSVPDDAIFLFNKEYDELNEIKTSSDLSSCFDQFVAAYGDPIYIVIDEIQDIIQRELFIRSKHATGKYRIIISGSNSSLLSGEFATYLTGRYHEIMVYPLSYREYLDITIQVDSGTSFNQYIEYGGLPEQTFLPNIETKKSYTKTILSDIILRDIVTRYKIKDPSLLYKILGYMAANAGKITSLKNISNYLSDVEHRDASPTTVSQYVSYLLTPYIIHKVSRYDIAGKQILQYKDKYFFNDCGIKHSIRFNLKQDLSGILENLIFIHYKTFGYEMYVGEHYTKEIDFIAIKGQEQIYIQIAQYITEDSTRDREFGNLLKIPNQHTKIVFSLDDIGSTMVDGIRWMNIRQFLAGIIS